jgi:hypothetical protein
MELDNGKTISGRMRHSEPCVKAEG